MSSSEPRDLARDRMKGIDAWYDKLFVRHLVKAIQDVDDSIGAIIYPDTKIIVFLWDGIIIHKLYLDAYNTDTLSIEDHVGKVRERLRILRLGIIPVSDLRNIRQQAKKLSGGKLL